MNETNKVIKEKYISVIQINKVILTFVDALNIPHLVVCLLSYLCRFSSRTILI